MILARDRRRSRRQNWDRSERLSPKSLAVECVETRFFLISFSVFVSLIWSRRRLTRFYREIDDGRAKHECPTQKDVSHSKPRPRKTKREMKIFLLFLSFPSLCFLQSDVFISNEVIFGSQNARKLKRRKSFRFQKYGFLCSSNSRKHISIFVAGVSSTTKRTDFFD